MEQTGYVTEINNGKIKVRVDRESACGGNCVSCKGCPADAIIVECDAPCGVKVGDIVKLTMPTKHFYFRAMLGYGIPVVFIIVGAVLGYTATKNDGVSIIGAAVGLVLGLLVAKLLTPKKNKIDAEILDN